MVCTGKNWRFQHTTVWMFGLPGKVLLESMLEGMAVLHTVLLLKRSVQEQCRILYILRYVDAGVWETALRNSVCSQRLFHEISWTGTRTPISSILENSISSEHRTHKGVVQFGTLFCVSGRNTQNTPDLLTGVVHVNSNIKIFTHPLTALFDQCPLIIGLITNYSKPRTSSYPLIVTAATRRVLTANIPAYFPCISLASTTEELRRRLYDQSRGISLETWNRVGRCRCHSYVVIFEKTAF